MAPPAALAVLPSKTQLSYTFWPLKDPRAVCTAPPPIDVASFDSKCTRVKVPSESTSLMAPPAAALLFLNAQSVSSFRK